MPKGKRELMALEPSEESIMARTEKQLSNPFSTGGGGVLFEAHVQACFVAMMVTGGFAPCLSGWPIKKIKLQGKHAGYDTDDLIIFVQKLDDGSQRKMLGQVKHSISITEANSTFGEVIQAAWNDFNNSDVFTRGQDVIALITGPLSTTDCYDTREVLEWARNSEDAEELLKKVELSKFSSQGKRTKLKAFRSQMRKANSGKDVSDEELFQFLRHFHLLGYDLDIKVGVTLSLLHSLIGQYSQENVHGLWTQLINEVQSANKSAGTITLETLPEEIRGVFKKRILEIIPPELVEGPALAAKPEWNQVIYANELAFANLMGAWNEKSVEDTAIIAQLVNEDYAAWVLKIRAILQLPESPIRLKNGIWTIADRRDLWEELGPRLFDNDLNRFRQSAIGVLTELDPQFDLPVEERYAASIHNKVLKHSPQLRKGLAESLALLGSSPDVLRNCSVGRAESVASSVVRDIFANADWVLWGSLNSHLPLLAEASPEMFLSAVETALRQEPCPIAALFSQEQHGITGRNYLTGLWWALETLAWGEQYLVRVTVILGELASLDPGGKWVNRPANSLATIYLPWLPQTIATIQKRSVALQTLRKEYPEIAWKLLLRLLPNQLQTSSGSHKPHWRQMIPHGWTKEVSQKDYWEHVTLYADMAVEMAQADIGRLDELIGYLDHLPQSTFEKILEHLSSDAITSTSEDERVGLWSGLVKFTSLHKRYTKARWALTPELVARIEEVSAALAPRDQILLHRRLFCGRDFDLYQEQGTWQEKQSRLEEQRQEAVRAILDVAGIGAVVHFTEATEFPLKVGYSLGFVAEPEVDSIILAKLLDGADKKLTQLVNGYIGGRYQSQGWAWVDKIDMTDWGHQQIVQFLTYLPFTSEAWKRAEKLLGKEEKAYWDRASVNPYHADSDLYPAVDKLIEYGRPNAAIACLGRILMDKQPLDKARAVRTLLAAVSTTESPYSMDVYETIEIIKALQDDPETDPDDLFRIEWAYLTLLDSYHDASPKRLEERLASSPDFFCEVIRLAYRSKNDPKPDVEPSEKEMAIALNAYELLRGWQTPPGIQPDGILSEEHLRQWFESIKLICGESGHLEVALAHIGSVLINSPADPDGLWINHAAAGILDGKDTDAETMRNSFRTALFNSRGVHWVDPTGKPEMELAANYRKQAEAVENAGYPRFATTLRSLAESYAKEAKLVFDEYKQKET